MTTKVVPSSPRRGFRLTDAHRALTLSAPLADLRKLLEWHDKARGSSGRPKKDLEVFKRAVVILAVTAWETFIEVMLQSSFTSRLGWAKSPREIRNLYAAIERERNNSGKLASDPEWKKIYLKSFKVDMESFHTPSSVKIRRLYLKYMDADVTTNWRWRGTSSRNACEKLDTLIKLRGNLTHKARYDGLAGKAAVQRITAARAIKLVERLASCTPDFLQYHRPR